MRQDIISRIDNNGREPIISDTSWKGTGNGYHIKIRHDETYKTLYAHCLAVFVKPGQEVEQREVIALVGNSSNSTGNHLHFEVREGGWNGVF